MPYAELTAVRTEAHTGADVNAYVVIDDEALEEMWTERAGGVRLRR